MLKQKKAAMEMSVGTIVTIVLLMTVLILGLVLVKSIFSSSTNAIDDIDKAIQGEISKLFEDENKKVVIYPASRDITMKKGDEGGFGFSIKNRDESTGSFTYEVLFGGKSQSCQMTEQQATNLIVYQDAGKTPIQIASGEELNDAVLVKYSIPDSASICNIRYILNVYKDGEIYVGGLSMDLTIK